MKKYLVLLTLVFGTTFATAAPTDTMNFTFSPFAVLFGLINGSLDYKLDDHFTAGPMLAYWNGSTGDLSVKLSSFGARGTYYFNSVFTDGLYVGATIGSTSFNIKTATSEISFNGIGYGIRGGQHWFWDSFNLNLGLNLGMSSKSKLTYTDDAGNTQEQPVPGMGVGLDFAIGYTF